MERKGKREGDYMKKAKEERGNGDWPHCTWEGLS